MHKKLIGLSFSLVCLLGFSLTFNQAAALTSDQIQAIISLVRSFGGDESTLSNVQMALVGGSVFGGTAQSTSYTTLPAIAPIGSIQAEPCVNLTINLRYRSTDQGTGGQVSLLQGFLQTRGYFNEKPSGFFGVLTLQAVKQFQKSIGISPTGVVGQLTRAKIRALSCFVTEVPSPTASIRVLSPNGGEIWTKGTTQTIKWQDNSLIPSCPVGQFCTSDVATAKFYDIKLAPYYPPCTGATCPAYAYREPYLIIQNVGGSSYNWLVAQTHGCDPSNTRISDDCAVPDGAYTVQVCQTGTVTCDSSDSYFTVTSSKVQTAPTISSLSPTQGSVGTSVAIQGSGFTATGNAVHFGIGGNANLSSKDGTTLTYVIPYSISICDFVGLGCTAPAQLVIPGTYDVYVVNGNGESNHVMFTVLLTPTVL